MGAWVQAGARPSEQKGLLIEAGPVSLQQDFADELRGVGNGSPWRAEDQTARSICGGGGGAGSGPVPAGLTLRVPGLSALSSEARM